MKKIYYLPITVTIIFAVISLGGGFVSSQWSSYHNFEGRCLECHLTIPGPGEAPRVFTKDISVMCKGCHKGVQEMSHPVDVKPSMQVTEKFPLDWKGDVTCATCHPIHQQGYGDFHLRARASGEAFCTLCHSSLDKDIHRAAMGTAHVSSSTGAKYVAWINENTLDELSLKCMSCHDAAFSRDSLVEPPPSPGLFHNNSELGLSHPIGVSYIEAKRKYQGAYRNMEELPPQIKLFGGQVGCGSCHNPYSKQHYELVMSNERSALCLACHVK